jgi:excisionase family DNA binding protein
MSSETKLLLRPREAAQALAISERTLWELTDKGEIRCFRHDRTVRYSLAELQKYIETHTS